MHTYTKFLNVIRAVKEATPAWPDLDANEEQLLNTLAVEWGKEKLVTVLRTIDLMPNVSLATAHRRITTLVDKGVLKLDVLANDRRIKAVMPTEMTLNYLNNLNQGLSHIES